MGSTGQIRRHIHSSRGGYEDQDCMSIERIQGINKAIHRENWQQRPTTPTSSLLNTNAVTFWVPIVSAVIDLSAVTSGQIVPHCVHQPKTAPRELALGGGPCCPGPANWRRTVCHSHCPESPQTVFCGLDLSTPAATKF